jgi:hypothetical protein
MQMCGRPLISQKSTDGSEPLRESAALVKVHDGAAAWAEGTFKPATTVAATAMAARRVRCLMSSSLEGAITESVVRRDRQASAAGDVRRVVVPSPS